MDIAQLGISIDSTQVVDGTVKLGAYVDAGERAIATNQRLAGSASSADAAQSAAATATEGAATSTSTAATAADRLIASLQRQIDLYAATDAAIASYNASAAKATESQTAQIEASAAMISQLQAEGAQRAQYYAQVEASAAAGDKFIASLQTQVDTIGLSKAQLLEYKAAQLGVADAAAPLIASIEAQTAALAASGTAAAAAGESEAQAMARISAMIAASREQAAAANDSTVASEGYAASIDTIAAAAARAEQGQLGLNTAQVELNAQIRAQTAQIVNLATALDGATKQEDANNAAITRTTAALERKLFALTATNAEMVAYDAGMAGATAEETAYQVSLAKSIEATTAQIAAEKAITAALGEHAVAAGGASIATASTTRELIVMGREIGRGDLSRLAGSASLLAQNMGLLGGILTPTGLAITGVTLGIGLSALAADKAAKSLSTYGESVAKIAEQTGVSTDFIQQFNYAVEATGGKAGEGGTAIEKLTLQIGKAEEGSKRVQATFAAVGVSMSDLKNLSPDQVMGKLADAFSTTQDNAAKFTIAQTLLGSSSKDLIDVLDQGSQGLAAYGVQADKVGAVLSDTVIQQSKQLHDQMATAKADWDGLVRTAETALLPTLLQVTKGLHDNSTEADVVTGFFKGVNEVFKLTAAAAATVGTGLNQMAELMVTGGTAAAFILKGQFSTAAAAVTNGLQNIKEEGNKYADFVKGLYKDIAPPPETIIQTQTLTAPKIGGAKAPNIPGALENQQIKDVQDQYKIIEDAFKNHLKILDTDRSAGTISDASYFNQEKTLYSQNLTDTLNYYDKQIAILKQGVPGENAKQRINDQTKINALQADATKAINDYVTAYTKLSNQEVTATRQRADALKDYNDRLRDQLATQKNAADLQVAALGQGSRESALGAQINAAQKAYDTAAEGIQKTFDRSKQTPNDKAQYDAQLAAQKNYESQVIAQDQQTYDRMTAAQQEWVGGVKKAWQDWGDSANNVSSQIGNTTTTALNGMTDSLTTFLTTGKLSFTSLASSFSSLADSIIKDLIRIAVQQAELKLVGMVASMFTAGAAGIGSAAGTAVTSTSTAGAFGQDLSSMGGAGVSTSFAGSGLGYATGGYITGPGSGTSDSIDAKLSNGEFVMNAAATAANRPMLEALNGGSQSSSSKAHFATGGFVGSSPSTVSGGTSIVFNITQGGASQQQPTTAGGDSKQKSAAMQKELESAVLAVVQKHSEPGGQINKIIKQVSR